MRNEKSGEQGDGDKVAMTIGERRWTGGHSLLAGHSGGGRQISSASRLYISNPK